MEQCHADVDNCNCELYVAYIIVLQQRKNDDDKQYLQKLAE